MASHAERRQAARIAREAKSRESARTQRLRLVGLGGVVALAAVVGVVLALTSSSGSTSTPAASAAAVARVGALLDGIPQSGTTLGNPSAPVSITEYGDLVCPVCASFASGPESALIRADVRSGRVKLVFRGLDTASSTANQSQYTNTQLAVRSAGLQNAGLYYILLAYEEQPQTINGAPAETAPYVTTAYLQRIAAQIHGLNLIRWQAGLTSQNLMNAVTADAQAANTAHVTGTPAIFVSGPKGTVASPSPVPSLADLDTLIQQVG